ncbi:lipid II flippase MurJ [Thermicanus aegyptius]|uniref:lipid II flippase MurJ n=1 Tax=Thermicanus aegyptius TaxID=94009 RepID=UPI00040DD49A|nr:lipid II flippase MurJ [Thermicanus aegyptius]
MKTSSFLSKSIGVSLIFILLACISFFKDVLFAIYFGTTAEADLFTLSFFLPDMVGNNLFATALGAVAVPFLSIYHARDERERLRETFGRLLLHIGLITLGITLLLYLMHPFILAFLFGSFASDLKRLGEGIYLFLLPSVLFFSLSGLGAALLQSTGRLYRQAFAPILFNGIFLVSLLLAITFRVSTDLGIYWAGGGILTGALGMLLFTFGSSWRFLLPLREMKLRPWDGNVETDGEVREFYRLLFSYLLVLLSMQSVLLMERFFAGALEPGTVAGLHYAYRLSQFPIWVFIAAINTVFLPLLSVKHGEGKRDEGFELLKRAAFLSLAIALPFSLLFFFARDALIRILFFYGSFNESSLRITSGILAGYALSVPFQAVSAVGLRYFLSRRRMVRVLLIYLLTSLVNILLDGWLVHLWGSPGIGWGMAISSLLNAVLIYWVAVRDDQIHQKQGGSYERSARHYSVL